LVLNQIIPAATDYQLQLSRAISGMAQNDIYDPTELTGILKAIGQHINVIIPLEKKMAALRKKANGESNIDNVAGIYNTEIRPIMSEIRYHCDKLEMYIADNLWPVPKYSELLITT
jgi:glutamine synthetase